jgi:hypothetical protein
MRQARLAAVAQTAQGRGCAGPAHAFGQRLCARQSCGQNADKAITGSGCIDRHDRVRRRSAEARRRRAGLGSLAPQRSHNIDAQRRVQGRGIGRAANPLGERARLILIDDDHPATAQCEE